MLVKRGESQSFSITASSDYHISDVAVNGVSVGAVSSYEMISISENMTITASFAATAAAAEVTPPATPSRPAPCAGTKP